MINTDIIPGHETSWAALAVLEALAEEQAVDRNKLPETKGSHH